MVKYFYLWGDLMKINTMKEFSNEQLDNIKTLLPIFKKYYKYEHMLCLLKYLKQSKEYLPDSRGDVSLSILSRAKILTNHEVQEVLSQRIKPLNKCGQYFQYSVL